VKGGDGEKLQKRGIDLPLLLEGGGQQRKLYSSTSREQEEEIRREREKKISVEETIYHESEAEETSGYREGSPSGSSSPKEQIPTLKEN